MKIGFWRWLYKCFPKKLSAFISVVFKAFVKAHFFEALIGLLLLIWSLLWLMILLFWPLIPIGSLLILHAYYREDQKWESS